jgi:hypothetical protein
VNKKFSKGKSVDNMDFYHLPSEFNEDLEKHQSFIFVSLVGKVKRTLRTKLSVNGLQIR